MDESERERIRQATRAELAKRMAADDRVAIARAEAEDIARIGHRPRVTFELVPVLWVRVIGESDPRDGAYFRADRGVCTQMIRAQIGGAIPVAIRSLGGGGGARSELHELGSEEQLRAFLLALDCIEESTDAG